MLTIATGLGSGYSPKAPGTAGTAVAVVLYFPLAWGCARLGAAGWVAYALATAAVAAAGIRAATWAEALFGKKDAGQVVIDEIAGYLVTMFLLPATLPWAMAGFAAFRLFDIWKPWPIHGLQRLKGGWGVMIDDLLAGAYACALLHAAGFILSVLRSS
jgi:phosphatidylglycerophosphatase A